jgi:hypothetical protein
VASSKYLVEIGALLDCTPYRITKGYPAQPDLWFKSEPGTMQLVCKPAQKLGLPLFRCDPEYRVALGGKKRFLG